MKYDVERDAKAFFMRCDGVPWREVGKEIGVSSTRAAQMANRHCRYLQYKIDVFTGADGRCGYSSYEMLNPQEND